MSAVVKSKRKKPSTLSLFQNKNAMMTLSERLKLAGIKEYKAQPGVKPTNLNRSSKKRKSTYKITTAEKHRNLPAGYLTKEPNKNLVLKSKNIILGNSSHSSPESNNNKIKNNSSNNNNNNNKGAEETLCVSLDFIKDCQKYKKKIRNPKEDIIWSNEEENKTSTFPTEIKHYYVKKKESQNLVKDYNLSWLLKEKELKNSAVNEDYLLQHNLYDKLNAKKTVGDKINNSLEDITAFLKTESLIDKLSLGDVARIDQKYLESVLSLATNTEPGNKKNLEKGEIGKERPKKSTGKTKENKELVLGYSTNENRTSSTKSSRAQLRRDQNSARIVRESTKSEVRIQLRDKKIIGGLRNSEEIKIEKETVHSKSELSDGRKKRKPRNKILKSNNKEGIEIPFSSEVSKAKDVKELWRRETKKKSENSLTSHSSCTIPETDENPKWKNLELQSYRVLHKLVEEEINKISKKSENKNNAKDVKNNETVQQVHGNKAESLKDNLKSKNIFNKLKLPTDENPIEEKEALLAKKKLILAENLQNYSTYEGENESELLSILDENSVKPPKGELKLSKETGKKCSKVPEQTIENWSILNRLEQAFIALGNSNFQNENQLKIKQGSKNTSAQNCQFTEKIPKESKEQKMIKSPNQKTHGTLSSRKKTIRLVPKPRLNNESVPSKKKMETPSPVCPSVQPKEQNKRDEPPRRETFNLSEQKKNEKQSLMRKKTFNVISLEDPSINQSKKFNVSNKTDKPDKPQQRPTQILKPEPETREKRIVKNKPLSRSKSTEKREVKPKIATPKQQAKPATNEKTFQPHENFKSGIPKPKIIIQKQQKSEKVMPIEEVVRGQVSEKKEPNQKSSNERPVKESSIFSVHRNKQQEALPPAEKFHLVPEKTFSPALKSSTGDLLIKNVQKNFENLYEKPELEAKNNNSGVYNMNKDSSLENELIGDSQNKVINFSKQKLSDSKSKLSSACSLSQNQLFQQNRVLEKNSQELYNSRNLSLWERDIRRYREIVKDIMSQYKRIDGFLKQSERLGISSNKSDRDDSSKKLFDNEDLSKFFNQSQAISLQDYRKKIITEYQTLPFFEYKQLKKEEYNKLDEARKRNLSVVSDINEEMDFDVKDYQPKIKKVLDSQLYVDKENLFKQIDPGEKLRSKKTSLQEMVLCHDRCYFKKNCLKSYSLPKTFQLPSGEVYALQSNDQRQKC